VKTVGKKHWNEKDRENGFRADFTGENGNEIWKKEKKHTPKAVNDSDESEISFSPADRALSTGMTRTRFLRYFRFENEGEKK